MGRNWLVAVLVAVLLTLCELVHNMSADLPVLTSGETAPATPAPGLFLGADDGLQAEEDVEKAVPEGFQEDREHNPSP